MKKYYYISTLLSVAGSLVAAAQSGPALPTRTAFTDWETPSVSVASESWLTHAEAATPPLKVSKNKKNTSPKGNPTESQFGYGFNFGNGFMSFKLERPSTTRLLGADPSLEISGGTRIGDFYYLFQTKQQAYEYLAPVAFVKYDPAKYSYTTIRRYQNPEDYPVLVDATWDALRSRMLAIGNKPGEESSTLWTVDPSTGALSKVYSFSGLRFSVMAADDDGEIYAVDINGDLYQIDGTSFVPRRIGATGFRPNYLSSMAFDRRAHNLLWAVCSSSSESKLIEINLAKGTGKDLGFIGSSSRPYEIQAMGIEYVAPAAGTPKPVTDLNVVPAQGGEGSLTMSWTNPSLTVGGTTLTSIPHVSILIDGKEVESITDAAPGAKMSKSLSGISSGRHSVRVVASNDAGTSDIRERHVWIGLDLPMAPTDISLERVSPAKALLKWKAPGAVGINGGYIDTSALKYRIIRHDVASGDSVVIQKVWRKGLEYSDETLSAPSAYYYTIQTLYADYGGTGVSPTRFLGPAYDTPFIGEFMNNGKFAQWTTYDLDGDDRTWQNTILGEYVINFSSFTKKNNVDDWLVTPPVKLSPDTVYYGFFQAYSGLDERYPKKVELYIGKSRDISTHRLLNTLEFGNKNVNNMRAAVKVDEEGEYFLSVRDNSPKTSSSLRMANFIICAKETAWLTGRITDSKGAPVEGVRIGVPQTDLYTFSDKDGNYKLDFINEGTWPVEYSCFGYYSQTDTLTFVNQKETVNNVSLRLLELSRLSGKVKDTKGAPVVNAEVSVTGYGADRTAFTDKEGAFEFKDVHTASYVMKIAKFKYVTIKDTLPISADKELDLTMEPKLLAPSYFKATPQGSAVDVSWQRPTEQFRHDSGIFDSQTGVLTGHRWYVFGAVFREPAVLHSIDWITTSYQGPHNKINLFIFDIDENERPTNRILWNKDDIETLGDEVWNHIELPSPVEAPNGYYLAASCDGMVSLAMDTGTHPDWPYVPHINFNSRDYRTNEWNEVASKRNYLIRANGHEIGDDVMEFDYRYIVYRFREEDGFNPSAWKMLTPAEGIADLKIADDLSGLPAGNYVYAIKTVYGPDKASDLLYSDPVSTASSGITDVTANLPISVWPNPTAGEVNFGINADHAALYSLNMAKMGEWKSTDRIDISDLQPGLYILRIMADNKSYVSKIIKK